MERINEQKEGLRDLAKRVLLWITCAKRPLTTIELLHALAVVVGASAIDKENLPQIEDILSVCGGLVRVDKESGTIRLVHYTTQEYFNQTREEWFPDAEDDITKVCITYLSFHAFESGFCQTDIGFEGRLRLNPLYNYVAHNWGHHAREALTICKQIFSFLESEPKIEAAIQALLAREWVPWHTSYSQLVQRQVTGLHIVAYFGVCEVANILIARGQHLELKDSHNRTPLSYAVENGHETTVKLLLEKSAGLELEAKDQAYHRTPLLWATKNGHDAVVKLLLEKGARLESKSYSGQTPLSMAAENGHEAVVKLLLEKDAQLETRGYTNSETPLFYAAHNGHEAVVTLLVEKGAELETKDKFYDQTPLSWAARNGHEVVAKLLLEKNAQLETKCHCGRTPLSWALENRHTAVAKLLLEKGTRPGTKDKEYGRTPLFYSIESGGKVQ